MLRKISAAVLLLCCVLSLVHVTRSVVPGLRGPAVVSAQVSWLARQAPAAAPRMQQLFPEGEFFTWALTGLAAGNLARDGQDRTRHLDVLERAIVETGKAHLAARFGDNDALPHGTFYHGWRLLLLVDRAALTGDAAHVTEAGDEAAAILAALRANPLPSSYPGQSWPCDVVVALAAVHRADALTPIPGLEEATAAWFDAMEAHRDPSSGLLVHQAVEPRARGSSQSIIQTFLPDIDPARAAREWRLYKKHFAAATLGLVGIREHAHGVDSAGDVDSGPLVGGVSASASAVTLAAARRQGDLALARVLDREADLLGMPLPTRSGAAFALGQMPVGDAFVAWARSTPLGEATGELSLEPWWWTVWLAALAPGALACALWLGGRRERAAGQPGPAQV